MQPLRCEPFAVIGGGDALLKVGDVEQLQRVGCPQRTAEVDEEELRDVAVDISRLQRQNSDAARLVQVVRACGVTAAPTTTVASAEQNFRVPDLGASSAPPPSPPHSPPTVTSLQQALQQALRCVSALASISVSWQHIQLHRLYW